MLRISSPKAFIEKVKKIMGNTQDIDPDTMIYKSTGLSISQVKNMASGKYSQPSSRTLLDCGFVPLIMDLETGSIYSVELHGSFFVKENEEAMRKLATIERPLVTIDLGSILDELK